MEKDKKGKRKLPISFFGKKGSFRFLFFKKGNEKRKKEASDFLFSKKEMKKGKRMLPISFFLKKGNEKGQKGKKARKRS